MRRIGIAVLVLALLLTAFCGFASAESQEISKYESDYMLLWEELTNSYPYLPYLEARGLDVSGLRAKYEAELPGLADAEAFAGMLQRLLKELGNFAHLDLVSPELYKSYYSIYVLDEQIAALPEAEPFREILQNPQLSGR